MAKGRIEELIIDGKYKDDHNRCFQVTSTTIDGKVAIRWGDGTRETVDAQQCLDSVVFQLDDHLVMFAD